MKHTITFEPDNTAIRVDKGANLLEAALAADVHINATCGGQGVCGKCRVVIEAGEVDSEKTEKVDQEEYEAGWRQACKTALLSDCTVRIPVESRGLKRLVAQKLDMGEAERKVSVLDTKPLAEGWHVDPMAIKLPVELTPPTLKDNVGDLSRFSAGLRLQHHIEDISVDIRCLKGMPDILRNSDWSVTATLMADPAQESLLSPKNRNRPLRLVRIEGGDTSGQNLAVALDVGTTTISAELIDLKAGRVMAGHAEYNGQIQYG
ncbi:MAG: 2Fe-2S iron-sulfur cluster binding domain-containing protein, partial [Desulfobacterales bacterium]